MFLLGSIIFLLEAPSLLFEILKKPLETQGIYYDEIQGGVLSGFRITNFNYNNELEAKEIALKININALENRILVIEDLLLSEVVIDKNFLKILLDTKTDANKSEGNSSLPFDSVVLNHADISIKDTMVYENYHIKQLSLEIFDVESNLKDKHKGKIILKIDSNVGSSNIKASLKDDFYNLTAQLEGNKKFIESFIQEENLTLPLNPKLTLLAKGNKKFVNYEMTVHRFVCKKDRYLLKSDSFLTKGKFNIKNNSLINKLNAKFTGNVLALNVDSQTKVDLDDINNSLILNFNVAFTPKKLALSLTQIPLFSEKNITIESLPNIKFMAQGDMKKLISNMEIKGFQAQQNGLNIKVKELNLKVNAEPLDGNIKTTLFSNFDSSMAHGNFSVTSDLNYKDLNNTLNFNSITNLELDKKYLSNLLEDKNITLKTNSKLAIYAKGSLNKVEFKSQLKNFKVSFDELNLELNRLELEGNVRPFQGDTEVSLWSSFDSTFGRGDSNINSKFNFNDINNSLNFINKTDVLIKESYVNNFLKEEKFKFKGDTKVLFSAEGNLKKIELNGDIKSKLLIEKSISNLMFKSTNFKVDLENKMVDGSMILNSKSKKIDLILNSSFKGGYMNPQALKTNSMLVVNHLNAFGLNLSTLVPINVDLNSSNRQVKVELNSKKINFEAHTSTLDNVFFTIKSEAIYPSKIIKIPTELKNTFIKLDLIGNATFSKRYFTLNGLLESNKAFKAHIDVNNKKSGLDVNIYTKHLSLKANGNVEKRNILAILSIDSLKKLQEEMAPIYPFDMISVDGSLELKTKVKKELFSITVDSPKLMFDGFNIEEIKFDGDYNNSLLTLNKLNFKTTGFSDKKLNKNFYLNQKGKIYLGERRDIFLDMYPKILVDIKGTRNNLKGDLSIEAIPLGHPEYGSMVLSSTIYYEQKGEKKKIVGGVSLEKMKLFYEAKFLDPAHDGDVVIITKKDKEKSKKSRDSFLEDTFIDLAIYAPDAKYKTKDVELDFTIDVSAKKDFGKNLGLLGKIRDINGRVEQAPKLFSLVDSTIVFRGIKEINPLLDIEVQHELADVLITIFIHGDSKHPKLDFASTPQMPKKDILSYLLFGISTANLSEGGGNLGREAQLFIMNQAARDLAYEVELDRVFIKDDGTGEGYAVQVGKKIDDKTMLIIENSKEGNSFILEYEVNKNIKVELGQHQKTVPSQSLDIFFRKKFK